jgi:DNA-binding PadR family transcriptional regulator
MSDPGNLLPLTPAAFHILLALADGENHGYGIMKEVAAISQGQLKLGPGTLYGTIKRMLADGWIEETDERPDPDLDDERRRYYRLTDLGGKVARAEAARLARLVEAARSKRLVAYPALSPGFSGEVRGEPRAS